MKMIKEMVLATYFEAQEVFEALSGDLRVNDLILTKIREK